MQTPPADRRSFLVGLGALSAVVVAARAVVTAQSDEDIAWLEHMGRAAEASEPYGGDAYAFLSVSADYGLCERPPSEYGATASREHISTIAGRAIRTGNVSVPAPPWPAAELPLALLSLRLKGVYKGLTPKDLMPTFIEIDRSGWRTGDQSPGEYNHYCQAQQAARCEMAKRQQAAIEKQVYLMGSVAAMHGLAARGVGLVPALSRLVPTLGAVAFISGSLGLSLAMAHFQIKVMAEEMCRTEACA